MDRRVRILERCRAEGGQPKNFLKPCLLLLIKERPDHGYDLIERLKELGSEREDAGTVYRSLRALERAGYVRSRWRLGSPGPARRIYELTDEGDEALAAWAEVLDANRQLLDLYLTRHANLTRPPLGSVGA